MNQKHIPNLELCQEFDTLCKEKGIVVPETEFIWERRMGNWSLVKRREEGVPYFDTADLKIYIPAPLVSEQGEWLSKNKCIIPRYSNQENYTGWFATKVNPTLNILENTEANARQKMLNYLLAEGIITKL